MLLFCAASRPPVGLIQPPIQWLLGILSLVILRPERVAKYSSPSSTEPKNDRTITSTPSYAFIASTGTPLTFHLYRVFQEESAILWEMIVCVILSKKVHMNMGPILNGYRGMVKRRYGPSCEHEQQLRNK